MSNGGPIDWRQVATRTAGGIVMLALAALIAFVGTLASSEDHQRDVTIIEERFDRDEAKIDEIQDDIEDIEDTVIKIDKKQEKILTILNERLPPKK